MQSSEAYRDQKLRVREYVKQCVLGPVTVPLSTLMGPLTRLGLCKRIRASRRPTGGDHVCKI